MENTLGSFIKELRKEKGLALRDLSKLTGISHSYLHILETGIDPRSKRPVSPTLLALQKLAAGLDVSLDVIIAHGLDQELSLQHPGRISRPQLDGLEVQEGPGNSYSAYTVDRDNFIMVPVLGKISAGQPCICEEDIEHWWPVDISIIKMYGKDFDKYFYLRVKEHSMEPVLNDRDLVLVKQGPVEDDHIAVVISQGQDACVKKVKYIPNQNQIMLISRNPDFPPLVKPVSECTIVGRVIFRLGEPKW